VAFYYRGHVNLRKGLTKSAISDYSAATNKFCAKMPDAHMALARVYERDNDLEHARKKYLDITQNFPNTKFSQEAMERLKNLP
jgi:TolA-binding protein